MSTTNEPCPCGSNLAYSNCCERLHTHQAVAKTPEELMRSRYSAFVLQQFDYLIETHHPAYRGQLNVQQLAESTPAQWLALQVESHAMAGDAGNVRFLAWYRDSAGIDAIHEHSNFVQEDGKWFYTDGKMLTVKMPGRNDSCICGSGKKFKQCCLKK
nr:YchJ family protein [Shewanella mangrovi]